MRGEGAGRPGDDEECLALPYEPFPPLIHLSHPPTLLESTLPLLDLRATLVFFFFSCRPPL